jgi:hypothetical protein
MSDEQIEQAIEAIQAMLERQAKGMRPRKNPSNVVTPANASKLRRFGAARRSSVGKIGPSSRSLVRAAADGATCLADAKDGGG